MDVTEFTERLFRGGHAFTFSVGCGGKTNGASGSALNRKSSPEDDRIAAGMVFVGLKECYWKRVSMGRAAEYLQTDRFAKSCWQFRSFTVW